MSTFETIYVIGHTIGSFLLLMVQFLVVKNYVVPFANKIYHFVVNDYDDFNIVFFALKKGISPLFLFSEKSSILST